jgi:hypothetical protein
MFVRGASSILLEHILGNVYEIISFYCTKEILTFYNIISLIAIIITLISFLNGREFAIRVGN